ncbi:hypothetical protein F0562_014227 [Nyssa sinensis]|uniref:Gnk2-homologous domain-containing protein n=1 Tax=Nyssa sinensis TaxID=561372 RepID=A0A5J4ZMU5_9ASTE|nr:hypothetical protein F0562_014227 [Nyssa sinensis]
MLLLQDLRANLLPLITIFGLINSSYGLPVPTYNYDFCLGSNNTANTSYQSNLSDLLGYLSSAAATNTFYKNTSNGIYGLYLCRGDVAIDVCQNCVNTANRDTQNRCPSNQQAIIWYDECMLYYSNTNFFGMEQTYPGVFMWNLQNNTSSTGTDVDTLALMYTLPKSVPCLFVGYSSARNAYKCFDPTTNRLYHSWHVLFDETQNGPNLVLSLSSASAPPLNAASSSVPQPPPVTLAMDTSFASSPGKAGTNTTKIVLISVSAFAVVAALVGIYLYCSLGGKRTQIVQIVPYLRGQRLYKFVDGSHPPPPYSLPDKSPNPEYETWVDYDQMVMSALLSSLSESIIAEVVGCRSARDVWLSLEKTYASISQARVVQTQLQLASLNKGSDFISVYYRRAKSLADTMAAAGRPLPSSEFVPYLLAGLGPDYDPLVSFVTTRIEPIGTEELLSHLLSHEARLQHHATNASLFSPNEPSTNFPSRGRGRNSHSRGGPNSGRGRGNRGRGGRGYSGNSHNYSSSSNTASRPICQVCNRVGHIALTCNYRFNQSYTATLSPSAHYSSSHH